MSVAHRLGALGVAVVIASSPLLAPSSADAAVKLTCRASVSDSTPKQYTDVYVRVRTAPHARVRTVAHYKTTNTVHAKKANAAGRATIDYYISSATAGYKVRVNVTVRKNGHVRTCSTAFTPHK